MTVRKAKTARCFKRSFDKNEIIIQSSCEFNSEGRPAIRYITKRRDKSLQIVRVGALKKPPSTNGGLGRWSDYQLCYLMGVMAVAGTVYCGLVRVLPIFVRKYTLSLFGQLNLSPIICIKNGPILLANLLSTVNCTDFRY